jgi:hypothetical protein
MDLRRIVDEVEERRRDELALVGAAESERRLSTGAGASGSLLVAVRERMLAEDPEADVASIDTVLEQDRVESPLPAPEADDFLDNYLEMSVVFEERYGIRGWADFVAKKTANPAGRTAVAKSRTSTKPKSSSKRKTNAGTKHKSTPKRKPGPKATRRRK